MQRPTNERPLSLALSQSQSQSQSQAMHPSLSPPSPPSSCPSPSPSLLKTRDLALSDAAMSSDERSFAVRARTLTQIRLVVSSTDMRVFVNDAAGIDTTPHTFSYETTSLESVLHNLDSSSASRICDAVLAQTHHRVVPRDILFANTVLAIVRCPSDSSESGMIVFGQSGVANKRFRRIHSRIADVANAMQDAFRQYSRALLSSSELLTQEFTVDISTASSSMSSNSTIAALAPTVSALSSAAAAVVVAAVVTQDVSPPRLLPSPSAHVQKRGRGDNAPRQVPVSLLGRPRAISPGEQEALDAVAALELADNGLESGSSAGSKRKRAQDTAREGYVRSPIPDRIERLV